jgi:hypothetical protein
MKTIFYTGIGIAIVLMVAGIVNAQELVITEKKPVIQKTGEKYIQNSKVLTVEEQTLELLKSINKQLIDINKKL